MSIGTIEVAVVLLAAASVLVGLSAWAWSVPDPPVERPARPPHAALVERAGRIVRRVMQRPSDVEADRRVGLAVLLAVAGLAVDPVLALGAGLAPFAADVVRRRRVRGRASASFVRDVPDVVDLFRVAANGGLTVHDAVREVGRVVTGPVEVALLEVQRRVGLGLRLADALPLVVDSGEPIRPLVRVLVSAERDGAPLAEPLERVSAHARDVRRRRAEEAARRVPVRLLFPLVVCVLPAFVLLTVVPLLAGTLQTVQP
jgi:pilus assembly protein TadC